MIPFRETSSRFHVAGQAAAKQLIEYAIPRCFRSVLPKETRILGVAARCGQKRVLCQHMSRDGPTVLISHIWTTGLLQHNQRETMRSVDLKYNL
jgi:hypothetical protein